MTLYNPELVLCDLDGTLVDSVPDLAIAVDNTMEQLGFSKRGEAKVREWIGNGIDNLVKRALLGKMDGEVDPVLFQRALTIHKQFYTECNGRYSKLYSGVSEGLAFLKKQGYPLVCITNKSEQFTLPLLKMLGIHDEFDLIISGDTLAKKKPDPLPLLYAAEYFRVAPCDSLMIGDSINDVQAARAAGFHIICVSYGYNHGEDIRTANPDVVIDSLTELPQFFVKKE